MTKRSRRRSFYGWVIVAVATFALAVSNGLAINGIPIFYKFVQSELVASGAVAPDRIQSVYGWAPALTFSLAGLLAPFAAFLLERIRPKNMMIAGCFILGLALVVYSRADSAAGVYVAHSLLGLSLCFVGVLSCTVLVSNWFRRYRGRALGLVLTGTSIGGVIIPQLATPAIRAYGWRWAMLMLSLTIWLVLLPAVVFLVRDLPSEIGSNVDGDGESQPAVNEVKASNGSALREALASPVFWMLAVVAALIFYAIFVVSQQLNLYLQGAKIGFSAERAAFVQSLIFFLSIGGKFLYGFLADLFRSPSVMLISAAMLFLSTLAFVYVDVSTIYLFAVLFGLNYGGTFVLLQLLVADHFGLRDYGKILGALTAVETIGASAGTIITGRIADADGGDYSRAFLLLIAVTAAALLLVVGMNIIYGPPRDGTA